MKIFYALMCVLGVILPFSQFFPWLYENGLSVSTLFQQATENKISTFAWLDVIVSAVVLIGFILAEGNRLSIKVTTQRIPSSLNNLLRKVRKLFIKQQCHSLG